MQEYRRSYHDEARRVRELEEQQRRLEASVQAVEICWTQVSYTRCFSLLCQELTVQLVNAVQDMVGKEAAESSLQALQRE